MSIDVGQILDQVQPLVESAILTVGSQWTQTRNPRGRQNAPTDRATGKAADPDPPTVVATGLPGIWVPDNAAGGQRYDGPNLPGSTEAGSLLLLPAVVDVQERDEFTCTDSRDLRLIGRTVKVTKVPDASAGAVRTLRAEIT